ncbi:MAG: hypothetical protein J5I52_08700 [Saprospiraceae bacterium]|nr:MAG: formiminoglutamase-like protein [Bacteroidetes bacterium OLB9]MCO6464214.1 hypothetical protein [Saprospiraceae bacterium]MCZ2339899.1 hypothetical protein [Chitinophagales bacterium]
MDFNLIKLNPLTNTDNFFNVINDFENHDFAFSQRGLAFISDLSEFSEGIRKVTQNFRNHFNNITLYDAGHLDGLDFSPFSAMLDHLNSHKVLPFIVGVDLDFTGRIAADNGLNLYQISNKINNVVSEDALINNNFLCYQRHLCAYDDIREIENNYINAISLGKLRTVPFLAEPVIRDCQLLHINLDAIRSSEVPGIENTLPTGLNSEELCQLLKYAGMASDLKAVLVTGCNVEADSTPSKLIAEIFWYLAEGMNQLISPDHPSVNSNFSTFVVTDTDQGSDIIFVRNDHTGRWWIQKSPNESHYMACAHEEYQMSVNDAVPERLQKYLYS